MFLEDALENVVLKGSTEAKHSNGIPAAIKRGFAHCFPNGK